MKTEVKRPKVEEFKNFQKRIDRIHGQLLSAHLSLPDIVTLGSLRVDTLGGHVRSASGVSGLRDGVNELTGDAEIAEFDVAPAIRQNIRGLDIAMNDFQLFLQVDQGPQGGQGDLAHNGFRYALVQVLVDKLK